MRVTKYVLIAAAVVAVLATIAWFLRDSLIQRISNPLLQKYGIVVTDVSLDALATSDATIGYLELVHDKGTTIAIENLTLPIGTASTGSKTYTAKKVSITTAAGKDGEPFELAQLIDQFLSLPDNLGSSELFVAEFKMSSYPTVRDLRWVLADGEQRLRVSVDSVAMLATITRTNATNHAVVFSLPTGSATAQEHFITANMQQYDQGISLSGTSLLDLPAWGPISKLTGIVPHEIEIESGAAALQFDVDFPYDASRSPTVTADLAPTALLQLAYSDTQGEIASVIVESGSSVELAATFPEVEWSLQLGQASLLITYGDWQEFPLSVSDLSCRSGPACSINTRISTGGAELPMAKVGQIELSSVEDVVFTDDGVRVDVQPGATLELGGLSTRDTEVGRIEARFVSAATLELVDTGWRFAADSLDGNIEAMTLSSDISVTTPLFLENVLVSELDQILFAKSGVYTPSSQASLDEQTITLPGFKGDVSLQGADVAIELETVGLHQNGTIKAQHNLDTGAGLLAVDDTTVSFGTQELSNRVSPWRDDWNLSAGTVSADLRASWSPSDSGLKFDGQGSARISDLAGNYGDTAFAGLSTELRTDYDGASGFTAKPSTITIELIEMGLPIENISADYTLNSDALGVKVENLRMTAFGGVIRADPFSFDTQRDRNTLILHAESIELDELLTLKEFEAIEVSGSIGARLPVMIEGNAITITGGTLTGEQPGGVIRYLPGREPVEADASGIGLVTRALSNFEYESLTSEVDYSEDGDLKLQLRLTGRNPDMDENRPVILNLGVENNVPQMLKSLRAARAVEEILEKRLGK